MLKALPQVKSISIYSNIHMIPFIPLKDLGGRARRRRLRTTSMSRKRSGRHDPLHGVEVVRSMSEHLSERGVVASGVTKR